MKIIFLDIDGCLTSEREGTYFNPDPAKYHPSKKVMKQLMKLCDKTGAKIVMATNWRKFDIDGEWVNKYGTYKNPLKEVQAFFGDYCIETLPRTRHINKAQATIIYLEEHDDIGSFVIFDDDTREQYQNTYEYGIKDNFILVDVANGITEHDINKAKDILSEEKQ